MKRPMAGLTLPEIQLTSGCVWLRFPLRSEKGAFVLHVRAGIKKVYAAGKGRKEGRA